MKEGIAVLAYGVLAGGFLTDKWLYKPLPSQEVCLCVPPIHPYIHAVYIQLILSLVSE